MVRSSNCKIKSRLKIKRCLKEVVKIMKKMKKHQHLVSPSMPVLLLLVGTNCSNPGMNCTNCTLSGTNCTNCTLSGTNCTNRGTNRGKYATIKACRKVGTTIVSTTFQIPRTVRINIAISFPNVTLIRNGTTAPTGPSTGSFLTSRS